MGNLSHLNRDGNARMVDTGDKERTRRTARASVRVILNEQASAAIFADSAGKGNVLTVAKIAGIQAAKRTAELIPLCHHVPLEHVDLRFTLDGEKNTLSITSAVTCEAKTGVEMEALTACSVAALTVYDMLKAVQKDIIVTELQLLEKRGGQSGDFRR